MGGALSLLYAARFPNKINKLVIINSFAKMNIDNWVEKSYMLLRLCAAYLLPIKLQAWLIAKFLFTERKLRQEFIAQMRMANRQAYKNYLNEIININIVDQISKIKATTLIISAKQDKIIDKRYAKLLSTQIKQAKLVILAGGHAVIADNYQAVNIQLQKFL